MKYEGRLKNSLWHLKSSLWLLKNMGIMDILFRIGMNICLFAKEEIDSNSLGSLNLKDERAKHILKILHKGVGDDFSAGIIGGMAGKAVISDISDSAISFEFKALSDGKELYPLDLIIGFPRPIQLKRLFRDVASLGVRSVHLTGTELGEKSYLQSNVIKDGSAYNMLLDGSVQAASTHVPELFVHNCLKDCLDSMSDESIKIALDNINPETSLLKFLSDQTFTKHAVSFTKYAVPFEKQPVAAAIGSERGWSERERRMLEEAGYIRLGMGKRILRTETASTVATSLILGAMGYLD